MILSGSAHGSEPPEETCAQAQAGEPPHRPGSPFVGELLSFAPFGVASFVAAAVIAVAARDGPGGPPPTEAARLANLNARVAANSLNIR
jgi:hypothetical protein